MNSTMTMTQPASGLAANLIRFWRDTIATRLNTGSRELRVVETLALGGRKQLHLVSCAGERFLVGAGADAVHTIVRVGVEEAPAGDAR